MSAVSKHNLYFFFLYMPPILNMYRVTRFCPPLLVCIEQNKTRYKKICATAQSLLFQAGNLENIVHLWLQGILNGICLNKPRQNFFLILPSLIEKIPSLLKFLCTKVLGTYSSYRQKEIKALSPLQ